MWRSPLPKGTLGDPHLAHMIPSSVPSNRDLRRSESVRPVKLNTRSVVELVTSDQDVNILGDVWSILVLANYMVSSIPTNWSKILKSVVQRCFFKIFTGVCSFQRTSPGARDFLERTFWTNTSTRTSTVSVTTNGLVGVLTTFWVPDKDNKSVWSLVCPNVFPTFFYPAFLPILRGPFGSPVVTINRYHTLLYTDYWSDCFPFYIWENFFSGIRNTSKLRVNYWKWELGVCSNCFTRCFMYMRLSDTSGLTSNPSNREMVSSSWSSEHQNIFFSIFFFRSVIVFFRGQYKRTVTDTLKFSDCRVARTTASASTASRCRDPTSVTWVLTNHQQPVQVMLPGTVPNLQIQKSPDYMLASSSVDHTILYAPPRVRFHPFQLPHNNICYPFLVIPNPCWWCDCELVFCPRDVLRTCTVCHQEIWVTRLGSQSSPSHTRASLAPTDEWSFCIVSRHT